MVDRIHCTCPNVFHPKDHMASVPTYYCCKVRLLKMKVTMGSNRHMHQSGLRWFAAALLAFISTAHYHPTHLVEADVHRWPSHPATCAPTVQPRGGRTRVRVAASRLWSPEEMAQLDMCPTWAQFTHCAFLQRHKRTTADQITGPARETAVD